MLCGGDHEENVLTAFAIFDTNGDGSISLDEMTTYLVSVFKLFYAAQPELADHVGAGPDELGEATARQAFEDADVDHDGKLR